MAVVLFLLSLAAAFVGVVGVLMAKSAVHEIGAGVSFVVAAVLLVGSLVLDTLKQILKKLAD